MRTMTVDGCGQPFRAWAASTSEAGDMLARSVVARVDHARASGVGT